MMSIVAPAVKSAAPRAAANEAFLAEEIRAELRALGDLVKIAVSVEEAVNVGATNSIGLVVVDGFRPDEEADAITERLRRGGVRAPVLFISEFLRSDAKVRSPSPDRESIINASAMTEFAARVEALARRLDGISSATLRFADIEMDLVRQIVRRGKKTVILRPREFRLLEFFLSHPGTVVTPEMLIKHVWRSRVSLSSNVIHVDIGQLRRKLGLVGRKSFIRNIRGVGYMLDDSL